MRSGLSSGVRRVGDAIKILLRDYTVPDRPDEERHIARQMREMILAGVALPEPLEVDECVIPGVEEEVLPPALPVVRAVFRRAGCEHFRNRLQKLKRNQIEARLAI